MLTSVRHPYIVMLHWSFQVSFDKTEGPEKPSNHVPTSVCHPRHCVSCGAGCCRRAAKRHLRVLIDIAMAIHGCTDIFHICLRLRYLDACQTVNCRRRPSCTWCWISSTAATCFLTSTGGLLLIHRTVHFAGHLCSSFCPH